MQKIRAAEVWHNRSEFINGRAEIVEFLTRNWHGELDYCSIKQRNENWEFEENGFGPRGCRTQARGFAPRLIPRAPLVVRSEMATFADAVRRCRSAAK